MNAGKAKQGLHILLFGFSKEESTGLMEAIRLCGGESNLVSDPGDFASLLDRPMSHIVIGELHSFAELSSDPFSNLGEFRPWMIVGVREGDIHQLVRRLRGLKWDSIFSWPPTHKEMCDLLKDADHRISIRRAEKLLEKGRRDYGCREKENYSLRDTFSHWGEYQSLGRVLHNLKTVLSQGRGPGMLISLMRMLEEMEKQSAKFEISREFRDLLYKNTIHSERVIDAIQYLDDVIRNGPVRVTGTDLDLIEIVVRSTEKVFEIAAKKRIRITKSIQESPNHGTTQAMIRLNPEAIESVVMELIINAIKFSPEESEVFVILQYKSGSISIVILNTPLSMDGVTGIPEEFEQDVFEPFFRIAHHVHEKLDTLDYGLGLTSAKMIVESHGGKIRIFNIQNHLFEIPSRVLVNTELTLPLISSSNFSG